MATLSNPINKANLLARFDDYVTSVANAGITWGTNNIPRFTGTQGPAVDVVSSSVFGGTTAGRSRAVGEGDLIDPVTAANIHNTLLLETQQFTAIRNMNFKLNITSSGFSPYNTGTYNTPGIIYDATAVAYMNYVQAMDSPGDGGVAAGNTITVDRMQTLFSLLQTAYNAKRALTDVVTTSICHASCHTSCHSSGRSRR